MENYEYLDLLEKKLDKTQKAVCCRTNNTIVAAGAGSGKTQVLATRFAWLVMSEGIEASKILTLTFTKKAAGEMYQRIYETLNFFAQNKDTPTLEKQRAKKALEDFSNVHIQTLDSYCSNIVRQAANLYGIRPDFQIESGGNDANKLALAFVFTNRYHPGVQNFSNCGQLQEFADLLSNITNSYSSICDSKHYFLNLFENQKKSLVTTWNYYFADSGLRPDNIPSNFLDMNSLFDFVKEKQAEALKQKGESPYVQAVQLAIDEWEKLEFGKGLFIKNPDEIENPEILEIAKKINNGLNNFSFSGNTPGYTKDLRAIIKEFRENGELVRSFTNYVSNLRKTRSFIELLDDFSAKVRESKRLSGNLSFKDVSNLALKILLEQKQIRKQEMHAYDKIMIDEFQDNNSANRDLLFLISEDDKNNPEYEPLDAIPEVSQIRKDKLFFVGDEKQSIYKFRDADVSVFNKLKVDLGEENFLQMYYNYRSDNELISSFNYLFGNHFSIFDNKTTEDYEAKYIANAIKYLPVEKKEMPFDCLSKDKVRVHACLCSKSSQELIENPISEKELMAYFMANQIKEIYNKELEEFKLGNRKNPPAYKDFAILDRSRTDRKYFTNFLSMLGIPYITDNNSNLFQDAPVNDLYNFLRLCVYPSDLNSFAAFLTSPLCGIREDSLETVISICLYPQYIEKSANVFIITSEYEELAFNELKESISETDFEKFNKAITLYKHLRPISLKQNIVKTITDLWIKTGYYYETILNTKVNLYSEQYDMLFELARLCDKDSRSLSWFVDQLAHFKNGEENAEMDASEISFPTEKNDGVQIMTIHRSKGLQFNHVFVYGCTNLRDKGEKSPVLFDEVNGISIKTKDENSNYFLDIQKEIQRKKEIAEFRRVFYVAITRAIKDVYIVGTWDQENKDSKGNQKIDWSDSEDYKFKLFERLVHIYYPEVEDSVNYALDKAEYKNIFGDNEIIPFDFLCIAPKPTDILFHDTDKEETYEFSDFYETIKTVDYIWPESNRRTPSSLEKSSKHLTQIPEDSDSGIKYEFGEELLENSNFSSADFGTLVHSYLQAYFNGIPLENFIPQARLIKNLSKEEELKYTKDAIELSKVFLSSDLGKKAIYAQENKKFLKAEWAFRMALDSYIYTGSIDLIFQNEDGTYQIVDYKSDNHIDSEKYLAQQECYKKASAKLLKVDEKQIHCSLFFLKTNKEIVLC